MKIKLSCAVAVLSFLVLSPLYGGALAKDFKKGKSSAPANVADNAGTAVNSASSASAKSGKADTASSVASSVKEVAPKKPKKVITGDPVVAKVGRSKEFRRSDVLKIIKTLPAQLTKGIDDDKLFSMCLDQLVSSYLMVEQAKKAGMDKTKDFLERVDAMKNELLARMFLMKEVTPKAENEAVLKAKYSEYCVKFKEIDETQVFHIMLSSEDDAKAVIERLAKGEDFGKIAKEKSLSPSKEKEGDEGYIAISILPDSIKSKLTPLKKGEYTKEPLKTDNGYHIFKVGETRKSSPQKYEDVKDGLKQMIIQEEVLKLVDRLSKQFNVIKFNEDGSPIAKESKVDKPESVKNEAGGKPESTSAIPAK